MTRDEIIKLATQAGWQMPAKWDSSDGFSRRLERFAALVAAAEREACAKVCEAKARLMSDHKSIGAEMCAAAIRARGQK